MYEYNDCLNHNTRELLNNSIGFYWGGMFTDEMKNNLLDFFLDSFTSDELIQFNWDDFVVNGLQFISKREYKEKQENFKDLQFGSNNYADHVLIMNDYGLDMCNYRFKGVK